MRVGILFGDSVLDLSGELVVVIFVVVIVLAADRGQITLRHRSRTRQASWLAAQIFGWLWEIPKSHAPLGRMQRHPLITPSGQELRRAARP